MLQKRTRTDGKNVGFSVPDEEIDTMPDDELEYHKRVRAIIITVRFDRLTLFNVINMKKNISSDIRQV